MSPGIRGHVRLLGAVLPYATLAAVKLWLVSAQARSALLLAGFDDGLFLRLARHIAAGGWLGPYDELTLVKGCGYPLWLALNSLHPYPQHLADHLLYLLATGLLVLALRPGLGRWGAAALFALVLFNPMSFTAQVSLRYIRSSIYPALTLLVFACALGLLMRRSGPCSRAVWAAALGLSTAALWLTREEGLWVIPAVALAFLLAWTGAGAAPRAPALPLAVAVAVSGAVLAGTLLVVSLVNLRHYGLFATNELKRPEFTHAMGALQRVAPHEHLRYVPVPLATQRRIAEVSPAFRELAPFLVPMPADNPFRKALGLAEDPRYEGELMAGWFVWAFRRAAARAGHHRSAADAMDYYARLAAQVNGACERGALPCGPQRSALAPVWTAAALADLPGALWRGVRRLAGFGEFEERAPGSRGAPRQLRRLGNFTGDRIEARRQPGQPRSTPPAVGPRATILRGIAATYRWVMPAASAAAAAVFALVLLLPRLRRRARWIAPAAVLLCAVAAFLLLLAWIDVSAFVGLRVHYLAPLYPLLLAFVGLMAAEAVGLRGKAGRGPGRAAPRPRPGSRTRLGASSRHGAPSAG